MVTDSTTAPVDEVFRALADPTRRRVVERLGGGPASVSELAAPFAMALPSFQQHLHVLEGCGLVRSSKQGRIRTYRLAPERLGVAADWLASQRDLWTRRLDQLDAFLLELHAEETRAAAAGGTGTPASPATPPATVAKERQP